MRTIVEVVAGPNAGARMELKTGQVGTAGRAHWAELSLPKDMSMAGQHFAVECGIEKCTLRALNRDKPVFLNDIKVGQELLKNGDLIVAGDNSFLVRIEEGAVALAAPGSVAAPPAPSSLWPAAPKSQQVVPGQPVDLLETLRRSQPLYALVNAARDERVFELLQKATEELECLYEDPAEELETVAPYLVRLPPESKLLETLAREGWGNAWGVYLTSHEPLKEVRKHFRHFLKVESEGEEYLFRFYDPRVLRVFLPVCNAEETKQFFGPVDCYLMETKEPALMLKYTATLKGVKEGMVPLFVA